MFKVFIDSGMGEREYTRYITPSSIKIQKTLNLPTTCTMTMIGSDENFVLPLPRSYVRIYSSENKRSIFTGLLTVDPSRQFMGLGRYIPTTKYQVYSYDLKFTSDEYLLSIKSVPFIPAFVNQTQGQILKTLAETLCPGYFDTSGIDSGDMVPYLVYDPTKSWADYAKEFCDSSRYRYSCIDKQIRFVPYNDGPLGVEYDEDGPEGSFDPHGLKTSAMTTPIVNDITVIGRQEAGNNHEDYFIGDGFTGAFPLKHKVFGLGTKYQGSSVLLADGWNQQLNTSNWTVQDSAGQFNYTAGALNIISGFELPPSTSYIYANNALELAGGIVIQHGEVVFNQRCSGIIGGIYDDQTLDPATCEAGFSVEPSQQVVITASGASGIMLQPFRNGAVVDRSFTVMTQINKSYTMYTKITAPTPIKYLQTYRSIAGAVYGGSNVNPDVTGSVTWTILETDLFSGQQTYYYFTAANLALPDTAIYGLINNYQLNITLNSTEIWTPPPGSLNVQCEVGSGLLAPIYISGSVQYTGAFVTPSGGNLPIETVSVDPNSSGGFGPEQLFDLGSGIGNQAAELDSGTLTDTLNFYSNDLPGVGTRIRLQTWESQAAISRVQDTTSIVQESTVVGDDGIRASVIKDLSPLPRTSEDCDNAALAFLKDRTGIFYQGTYQASYFFFKQVTGDPEYYPACGRYLRVNSPQRGIINQNFIVSSLTTTIVEMGGEILTHAITFGPDLYLEKMLASLVPLAPNVLEPLDTAIQVTPIELSRVGTHYLSDVAQTTIVPQITGSEITINFSDTLPSNSVYEVRNSDLNWGMADKTLIFRVSQNGTYTFTRNQVDQSWFIRMVSGAYIPLGGNNSQFSLTGIATSRRTKVLRVAYPKVPSVPKYLYGDTSFIQMDFLGDTRNIEGLEIREIDDRSIVYQCIVGSRFDMGIDMDALRGKLLPGQQGLNGLGQFLIQPLPAEARQLTAHFFNLMWEYGPALVINTPAPAGPTLAEAYRWGPALQVTITPNPVDAQRQDILNTVVQFCSDTTFVDTALVYIQVQQAGLPGFVTSNVPVTNDIYVRAQFIDHVGAGGWSNVLHVPQGNLLDSAYLSAQGSVPPVITDSIGASGGLFSYTATSGSILMASEQFTILYPNKNTDRVYPSSHLFTTSVDYGQPLIPATSYGFFPTVMGATTNNPQLVFNGPYVNYASSSTVAQLSAMYADGSVPLVDGAFIVQTASATGGSSGTPTGYSGGGGGGGTYGGTPGGSHCGIPSSKITLASSETTTLGELEVGAEVMSTLGKINKVAKKTTVSEAVYGYKTRSGLESHTSISHTLKSDGAWLAIDEILSEMVSGAKVYLETVNSERDELLSMVYEGRSYVIQLELSGEDCDHTYILDGFYCHNTMVKAI